MRPTTKTTNLTPARTDLIGRDLELARLRELFAEGRFVTVVGVGGTGKTRLAREFGHMTVPDFPGGVWMVELAKFDAVDEALRDLAEMLGLRFGTGASSVAPIIEALRDRPRTLLVLDNVEHLVESIADPIARILDRTPEVCVLTTSREPVRIAGEQRFKLSPLGREAAVKLFERRAAEVIPTFQVDAAEREAIGELVDRLNRLPLAIELAASRVNVLPPEQLSNRITTRMRALRARDRDRPARHETLQATIEWSWELLDPVQREGLAQCSVFRGGFTLDALAAVVDHGGLVEDLVEDLVERSLIEFEDTEQGRRFFLFEMVRNVADTKLEASGRAAEVFERHARYYSELVLNAPAAQTYRWQKELPNLLVALRRSAGDDALQANVAVAVARLLRLSAGIGLIEETLSELLGTTSDRRLVAQLLLHRALSLADRGELEASLADTEQAFKSASKAGDLETAADARGVHGFSLFEAGRADEGAEVLQDALRLANDARSARLQAIALGNLALVAAQSGDVDSAEDLMSQALSSAKGARDDVLTGRALMSLGEMQARQQRWHEALANFEESLVYNEKVGDDRYRGLAYTEIGTVNAHLGDVEPAAEAFTLGQEFAHALGDRAAEARALIGLGELGRGSGDRTYLVKALQLCEGNPDWRAEARARSHLAVHDMLARQHELARPGLRRAIGAVGEGDPAWTGVLWGYLAASYAMTQDERGSTEALDHMRESLAATQAFDPDLFADLVRLELAANLAEPADVSAFRGRLDAVEPMYAVGAWSGHDPVQTLHAVVDTLFGPASARTLALTADGRRFVPPDADEVDFSRRGPLRKILVALARACDETPGKGLSPDDVLEAGWPGDIVTPDAGAARVYSAVRTLRTSGLEDVLLTQDDGYLIDPEVSIVWLGNT